MLGLYEPVLGALTQLDLGVLAPLALGCAVGLMAFANLLAWLMRQYRARLLSLLTGFMLGSLVRLWPWSYDGELLLPADFAVLSGLEPMLIPTLFSAFCGGTVIWFFSRLE